jgi:diguanylate cyclase (GGDEF)-like protein
MSNLIALDLFSIVPLLFTISLAKRHILENKKNSYYIAAACMTIVILTLEIISNLILDSSGAQFIIAHKIVNVLGFALSPIVPYLFLQFVSTKVPVNKQDIRWVLPLYFNALLCVLSYWMGFVFKIDASNHYERGILFLMPTLVSLVYFCLVIFEILENRAKAARPDKMILVMIFSLPILSFTVQIAYPNLLLIWPSVSLSLLLYYIYSLEMQYDFDIQTKIKNRTAFDKEMLRNDTRKNVTLFVFDLNNLKSINDLYGHDEGDILIKSSATLLNTCFAEIGDVFRIGGDEFCAICDDLTDDDAENFLLTLKTLTDEFNNKAKNKLEMAHGYSHYDHQSGETIYEALSRADDFMYAHKAYMKATLGRRATDQ